VSLKDFLEFARRATKSVALLGIGEVHHAIEGDQMPKIMDHGDYQKRVKKMDEAALVYVMQDARNAIEAMPHGENAGYYSDEIHYCGMELTRRRKGK
jgi:cytochrome c5